MIIGVALVSKDSVVKSIKTKSNIIPFVEKQQYEAISAPGSNSNSEPYRVMYTNPYSYSSPKKRIKKNSSPKRRIKKKVVTQSQFLQKQMSGLEDTAKDLLKLLKESGDKQRHLIKENEE